MRDYTPTTEQVRVDYVMAYTDRESSQLLAERAFDRWLAARDAEVAAKAWDEGYAVGEDNFIHSDYCGRRCQCQGLHGATNPYREGGDDA